MKSLASILWASLILIAVFLRFGNLNEISFSYDQARDAFISQEILRGDLKTVGPPTDIQGVFHGPIYYYALAPIYAISRDPRLVVIAFSFLNILSGLFLSYFIYKITKSKVVPLIFFFFFAVSPELVFYSRFISNISLVIPSLALAIYSTQFLPKTKSYLGLAIGLGFAAQSEFFLLSLAPIVFVYLLLKKTRIKNQIIFCSVYFLSISPYALAEIKFKFRGLISFFSFSKGTGSNIFEIGERFVAGYSFLFSRNIFSFGNILIIVFLILIVYWFIKQISTNKLNNKISFILLLFLSPLLLMVFVYPGPIFFTIAALLPLFILLSIFLGKYPILIPIVVLFTFINCFSLYKTGLERSGTYTGSESGQILSDEMKVVDLVSTLGADTTYDSVTAPMYTNTLWSYLFDWYGKSHYGFTPKWHGTGQTGMPGGEVVSIGTGKEVNSVLIVDSGRVPQNWQDSGIDKESFYSDLARTEKIGIYKVFIGIRKQ